MTPNTPPTNIYDTRDMRKLAERVEIELSEMTEAYPLPSGITEEERLEEISDEQYGLTVAAFLKVFCNREE